MRSGALARIDRRPTSRATATRSSRRSAQKATSNMRRSRNTAARPRAHEIVPVKGQALAFMVGGVLRFARKVEHPGSLIPERSYLRSTLDEMSGDIVAALRRRRGGELGGDMSREAAFSALFAAVSAAYSWGLGLAADEAVERSARRVAPGVVSTRVGSGNLSMDLAGDAAANARSQALPLFRRPRSARRPARPRSTPRSTRSTRRWRPRRCDLATRAADARRRGARLQDRRRAGARHRRPRRRRAGGGEREAGGAVRDVTATAAVIEVFAQAMERAERAGAVLQRNVLRRRRPRPGRRDEVDRQCESRRSWRTAVGCDVRNRPRRQAQRGLLPSDRTRGDPAHSSRSCPKGGGRDSPGAHPSRAHGTGEVKSSGGNSRRLFMAEGYHRGRHSAAVHPARHGPRYRDVRRFGAKIQPQPAPPSPPATGFRAGVGPTAAQAPPRNPRRRSPGRATRRFRPRRSRGRRPNRTAKARPSSIPSPGARSPFPQDRGLNRLRRRVGSTRATCRKGGRFCRRRHRRLGVIQARWRFISKATAPNSAREQRKTTHRWRATFSFARKSRDIPRRWMKMAPSGSMIPARTLLELTIPTEQLGHFSSRQARPTLAVSRA